MSPCEKPYAPIAPERSTTTPQSTASRERAVELGGLELADALQRVEAKLAPDDRRAQQQLARPVG